MTIASTKLAVRYTERSNTADSCAGCTHAGDRPECGPTRTRCDENGFYVARAGWCIKHKPRVALAPDFSVRSLDGGDFEVQQRAGRIQIGPTDI